MTGDVLVRRATLADLDAIVGLYFGDSFHAAHEPVDGSGEDATSPTRIADDRREAFDAITGDPRELLLVAERAGRVIGTLQLTFLRYLTYGGARVALVEAVQVAASERSSGVGATMMRFAIDEARRHGCNRVQLTSNKARQDAHRFYERLGFVPSHEGFKMFL